MLDVASVSSDNVVTPVTDKVPAVATLPEVSATVNLLLSQAIPPLALRAPVKVVAPVTAKVDDNVAASVTSKVPDNSRLPNAKLPSVPLNTSPVFVASVKNVNLLVLSS